MDIFKLLSNGERVTLECKKATKRYTKFSLGHLLRFCKHIWWYHSLGGYRTHGRARQYQTI